MPGSSPLDNYDRKSAEKALKMLLIDRSNEFRELARYWISYYNKRLGTNSLEFLS